MWISGGVYSIKVTNGGTGYSSNPTVTISAGSPTATAVAQRTGTVVTAVFITATGQYDSTPTVTFSGGGGSGAVATASCLTFSPATPMCFFKGRYEAMFGVNGLSRGFRWDGKTAVIHPLGISKPNKPTMASAGASSGSYVNALQIISSGSGYTIAPTVTFIGGGLANGSADHARAYLFISNGRIASYHIESRGTGYTSAPEVVLSGGTGSGATITVGVKGTLSYFEVTNRGAGITGTNQPTVTVSGGGITGAVAVADVDSTHGLLNSVYVLAAGTGATTTPTVSMNFGTYAPSTLPVVKPVMVYTISAATVGNSGSGFYTSPTLTLRPYNATALLSPNISGGHLASVEVIAGGSFDTPPTCVIEPTDGKVTCGMTPQIGGKYQCCLRYIDSTSEPEGGPIPSSISELTSVDGASGVSGINWTWSNDGIEARVDKIELWRTSPNQITTLYRVATLSKTAGVLPNTYSDTVADYVLIDPERVGYGLMPIVLPSGMTNARRFVVPPTNLTQGVMFQDRAWYAVDSSGLKPNSLYFSEIDEPESCDPDTNEMIVQENTTDCDKIVALVPFGSSLLIAQRRHVYRLQYVAQPIFDASLSVVSYRGAINAQCCLVFGGAVFFVDEYGAFAFDGNTEESISAAIDNLWRDGTIDWSQSASFFLSVEASHRIIRFFFAKPGDTDIRRALCYCVATKSWWEETYPTAVTCSTIARIGNQAREIRGNATGSFLRTSNATLNDVGTPIPLTIRIGALPLISEDDDRSLSMIYAPTSTASTLNLGLHYNNSTAPRPNAISSVNGIGFVVSGSTTADLDLQRTVSPLGDSTGFAKVYYSGRLEDRSRSADRHLAVGLTASQTGSSNQRVVVYSLKVSGVTV